MKYIGNINIKESFKPIDFISINQKDDELPNLYVGWENTKQIFTANNISILEKKIDKNNRWTFSKYEKRNEFEKDIEDFYKKCVDNVKKKITYKVINPLLVSRREVIDILKKCEDKTIKYAFIEKNNFLYLKYENEIYGLSFKKCAYIGINYEKIIYFLNKNNIKIIDNTYFLSNKFKEIIEDNNVIIPFLYSLKNEE